MRDKNSKFLNFTGAKEITRHQKISCEDLKKHMARFLNSGGSIKKITSMLSKKKANQFVNLSAYLSQSGILFGLNGTNKLDIILKLVAVLKEEAKSINSNNIVLNLMEQEERKPTTVTGGVVILHCMSDKLKGIEVVLGISRKGLKFNSAEGQKVNLIFLIVSPPSLKFDYLSLVVNIVNLKMSSAFTSKLLLMDDPQAVLRFIRDTELKIKNKAPFVTKVVR